MAQKAPGINVESKAAPLFNQVAFHIIQNERLSSEDVVNLRQTLTENGAVEHSPPSDHGKVPVDGLTHIISLSIDFEGYEAADNRMIAVVKPTWIEASVLKRRVANPKSHSPDPRLFFSGLVVCMADLPDGDKDAIIGGVLAMGGLYSGAISKLVTHIVALDMEPQACKVAVSKNLDCKIVLPHWFDDCLRLGRRIEETPYLLPNPEVMRMRSSDHINNVARPDLEMATSAHGDCLSSPTDLLSRERKQLSVFENKAILLSNDLCIADHLRATIESLIVSGGGQMSQHVSDADILICQYREGNEYRTASSENKTVGNLPWLYHLIMHNTWTSPLRRLLHYPIAREGLPGFKQYRISLSNYNGEARIYLENLAKAAGCEFTKTMKMDNTHLITAHTYSEKCDAAREWSIHMVNHLWLEESYAKWQIQSVTNSRYVHFPPRTNLGEVVGQTPIDKQVLETFFIPKSSKRLDVQNDKNITSRPAEHSEVKHVEDDSSGRPGSHKNQALTSRSKNSEALSPNFGHVRAPTGTAGPAETPEPSKADGGGKENMTPSTTGSRSAKERATARIHDLAPDIALFEREKKRVGGVVFGGRRMSGDVASGISRKRSTSSEEESDKDEELGERNPKRARKGKGPPLMRLLVTGYTKWTEDERGFQKDKERLRRLGILLTTDYARCTYLAAPKILRTKKFICAMAQGPTLLDIRFVEDCLENDKLLPVDNYPLRDAEGENRYRLKLPDAIKRAKMNKGRLLRGQLVYVTDNIYGGFDTYKSITEANGGKCVLYKARAGIAMTRASSGSELDEEESRYVYLISGFTPSEAKHWPKFSRMVHDAGRTPRIVKTDWMLDLALSQQVRWDHAYEMTDNDIKDDT